MMYRRPLSDEYDQDELLAEMDYAPDYGVIPQPLEFDKQTPREYEPDWDKYLEAALDSAESLEAEEDELEEGATSEDVELLPQIEDFLNKLLQGEH